MTALDALRRGNPHLTILSLAETPEHALYRRADVDAGAFLAAAKAIVPEEANAYIPRDEAMSASPAAHAVARRVFGELPMQAGWNYGGNTRMNGMEWHKSAEVVVACTDVVLLLGSHADIHDDAYDSARAFGLYLQAGEAVELHPYTLHLAPLPVSGGRFVAAILLPEGTNLPLAGGIEGTLRAVNKWLLVHPDNRRGVELGGKIGVFGENISLVGLD
ncbi:MAG: DUF4867 family protein [Clostridiales bacterium]|nr:DUF4867 family protein [Clostridiales bacterium]